MRLIPSFYIYSIDRMSGWGNPLKPKAPKKEKEERGPKEPKTKELPKFKAVKLTLTKSEAKKVLNLERRTPSVLQTAWTQRWLEQLIRERTLPPQLAGADAYGQLCLFLSPDDCLRVLTQIRADFDKTLPLDESPRDEFDFLRGLELEAYHEHLFRPRTDDHNSHLSDDDP